MHRFLAVVPLVWLASCDSPKRADDHQLISAVILNTIAQLPDSADSLLLASYGPLTQDSSRMVFESIWLGWWHTAMENRLALPGAVRARFAKHFDIDSPPPDPYPEIDAHDTVRDRQTLTDSTISAEVGVSFSSCRYTFLRPAQTWRMAAVEPQDCRISSRVPSNQRLKLTARGGRVVGNGSVLIAAAAGRSLSAIR